MLKCSRLNASLYWRPSFILKINTIRSIIHLKVLIALWHSANEIFVRVSRVTLHCVCVRACLCELAYMSEGKGINDNEKGERQTQTHIEANNNTMCPSGPSGQAAPSLFSSTSYFCYFSFKFFFLLLLFLFVLYFCTALH